MRRDQYLSFKHHIDGEFSVEQYESRKTDLLEYAVICRLTGVEDVQVYNIRVKDDKAVRVTMRCKNTHKKKKGDSDYSWVEVIPIVAS